MKSISIVILIFCASNSFSQRNRDAERISQSVFALTNVMFHDVVNPPAAARFYSYSLLSAYEVYGKLHKNIDSIQRIINQYPAIPVVPNKKYTIKEFASLYALLETGKNILPTGYLLEEEQEKLYNSYKKKYKKQMLDSSVAFAKKISAYIVAFAKTDGYFKLSTYDRYKLRNTDSTWTPTPPEYMGAVEPYWHTMRTFFLDSAKQFRSLPPTVFSKEKSSDFFALMTDVYKTGNDLTTIQKEIANFWDCNPFAVQFSGHMSVGLKKISPGGHWMGIAGIACRNARFNFEKTLRVHTMLALSLHDAFICCWTEKYESHRIRPETAINRYIDQTWKPFLQTPPFPEYTSGHSVISTTAAELLTFFFGRFSFIDTTESYIGLPSRKFNSFREAADEACISRLYGGIHFRDAIENGKEQGKRVAKFILMKYVKQYGNAGRSKEIRLAEN
jgi:hypothetical protein